MKKIMGLNRLRLRGPNGAKDEFKLAATAQNQRKMAKLLPTPARRSVEPPKTVFHFARQHLVLQQNWRKADLRCAMYKRRRRSGLGPSSLVRRGTNSIQLKRMRCDGDWRWFFDFNIRQTQHANASVRP